jgi:hypothetical protein
VAALGEKREAVKIKLTQEHIDMDTPRSRNQTFSPLSLALLEATGVLWNVDYARCYPCGWGKDAKMSVKLPPDAYQWVEDYDHSKPVGPAEFEMELPDTSFITAGLPWEEVRKTFAGNRAGS